MADFKAVLPNFTRPADVTFAFDFERNFDHETVLGWFQRYWTSGFLFCSIYLVLIYFGQKYMQNRPRFELYLPLCTWSFTLAIFSLCVTIRGGNEFVYIVRNYGWHGTVCDPTCCISVTGYWAFLFTASKLVELGDTAFIILRKQKLIFLHWYHHITVLLYTWYGYGYANAPGRCFVLMNAVVHTLMYSYYTVKASKLVTIPRWINIFITIFQTSQMFVGMLVNLYALYVLNNGGDCATTYQNIRASFLMYASYFALFVHFFCTAYLGKKPSAAAKTTVKDEVASTSNGHVANNNGVSMVTSADVSFNGHGHVANGIASGDEKKKDL